MLILFYFIVIYISCRFVIVLMICLCIDLINRLFYIFCRQEALFALLHLPNQGRGRTPLNPPFGRYPQTPIIPQPSRPRVPTFWNRHPYRRCLYMLRRRHQGYICVIHSALRLPCRRNIRVLSVNKIKLKLAIIFSVIFKRCALRFFLWNIETHQGWWVARLWFRMNHSRRHPNPALKPTQRLWRQWRNGEALPIDGQGRPSGLEGSGDHNCPQRWGFQRGWPHNPFG